ncbi:MAG: hypothetical protein KDB94_06650 [Acidobacteria bacterium]|nr:hypothetical protein [Acidobacteriota bacterium]MCB9378455.1 hypothetical protein [Holophagales bacterium]
MKPRRPRHERRRYQRLPLPVWVRVLVLVAGWALVLIGIAGLFLPIIQGGLSLVLGFALLSIASQTVHLWLRRLMGRWPGAWKRLERFRRKLHARIERMHRRDGGEAAGRDDSADSRKS